MNMFKVQMDMFSKHHSTVKEQEQEFLKTQQIEMRTTQNELMDQQRQASIVQNILSRLPKLSEKSKVALFFLQFEKTLEDHDIPSRKWLQALQSSLDGSLVDVYWDTFRQEERDTYEVSKCTLMKWCVFSITECIQQVGVVRMKHLETIQEAYKESLNHVKTLSNGDSAEQVRFNWAKARTLAKVKRECAEAVWAKKQTDRQQHRPQQQQQFDSNDQMKSPQHAERRDQSRPQQQTGQQQPFGERQSGGRTFTTGGQETKPYS